MFNLLRQKIIVFLFYSYVVLIPLFYLKASKSVFSMPKLAAVRFLAIALIIVIFWEFFYQKKIQYLSSRFNTLILFYAATLIASTIFSSQIYASILGIHGRFAGLITMLNLLGLALLAFHFFPKSQISVLTKISVLTAIVLAVWGIFQHYGIFVGRYWTMDPTQRAFASIEHGNHYAAYLIFNLALLWGSALNFFKAKFSQKSEIIIKIVLSLIFIAAIWFTASRAALITLLISAVVFAFLNIPQKNIRLFFRRLKKTILAVCVSGLLIIFITFISSGIQNFFLKNTLIQRSVETFQFIKKGHIPDRLSWYLSSLSMFRDHPIFGHGLSTYKDTYNLYRRADYRNPHDSQYEITPETAHNDYFNQLAEIGLVGLSAYLVFIGFVLKNAWRRLHNIQSAEDKLFLSGLITAIVSYLVQVFFSFGVITTFTLFYFFLGVLVKITDSDSGQLKKISFTPAKKIVLTLVMLIMAIGIYKITSRQFRAEVMFRQADDAARDLNYRQALTFADKMVEIMPYEYVYFQILGDNLYQVAVEEKDLNQAIILFDSSTQAYAEALKISPRMPYLHANLALAYYLYGSVWQDLGEPLKSQDKFQKAQESYENAIKYSPNNPLYNYNYATILLDLKNPDEAAKQLQEVRQIRPDYKDSAFLLATTYAELEKYSEAIQILREEETSGRGGPENNRLWEKIEAILRAQK